MIIEAGHSLRSPQGLFSPALALTGWPARFFNWLFCGNNAHIGYHDALEYEAAPVEALCVAYLYPDIRKGGGKKNRIKIKQKNMVSSGCIREFMVGLQQVTLCGQSKEALAGKKLIGLSKYLFGRSLR